MAINRNSYKSLLESIQDATETLDETDSMWLSRGAKARVSSIAGKRIAKTSNPTKTTKASAASAPRLSTGAGVNKPLQWGDARIGGAMNGMELAKWLNSQTVSSPSISEDEQWDEIDEILAEGVEMYGEDGLAEILADFAETGEISEELAEIIEAVAQFNPMELARHLNAGTHADYLAQFGQGIANPNAASLAPASKTAATNRKMAAKPAVKPSGMKPVAKKPMGKPMGKPTMKAKPTY